MHYDSHMTKHKRKMVKPLLLVALFLFSIVTAPLMRAASAAADTQGLAGLVYDDKVYKSLSTHQHYWWLYSCFKNTDIDRITQSEMNSWDFFQGNSQESALGEMYGNGDGGTANCESESVVQTAFGYLGETDPYTAFCQITGRQFDGNNVDFDTCKAGPGGGDWDNNASKDERTASYASIWGSKDPAMTGAMQYMRAYSTFMQGCDVTFVNDTVYDDLASVNNAGAAGNTNKYPVPVVVPNTSTAANAPAYVVKYRLGIGVAGSEKQIVVANSQRAVAATRYTGGVVPWTTATCDELATTARENALAYAVQLQKDGITADANTTTTPSGSVTPTCEVNGFGWVICPLIGMMADATNAVADFLGTYLQVKPLTTDTNSVLYKGWSNILAIANLLLIIPFLFIVFSQATSIGIGSYGIKKLLPRIIAAAILINLSYFICAALVDISNIVGANIANLIYDNLGGITTNSQGGGLVGGIKNIAGGITAGLIGVSGLVVVAFFFLIPAVIAVLSIFVVIAARSAILTLLIIIAPLAFAAWVLPNTDKWFKKWWDIFIQMLVIYPAIMAIFAASSAAATIVVDSSATSSTNQPGPGNLFPMLIGLLIQALPLFALPALIKLSSGVLARINNLTSARLNKAGGDSAHRGLQNYSKRQLQNRSAQMATNNWQHQSGLKGRLGRGAAFTGGYKTRRDFKIRQQEESARKLQDEAVTERVLANSGDNRFASAAAGVGGAAGVTRVQAAAVAHEREESRKRVSQAQQLYSFKEQGKSWDEMMAMYEQDYQKAAAEGNHETLSAILQQTHSKGGGGRAVASNLLTTYGVQGEEAQKRVEETVYQDMSLGARADIVKGGMGTNGKWELKDVGALPTKQIAALDGDVLKDALVDAQGQVKMVTRTVTDPQTGQKRQLSEPVISAAQAHEILTTPGLRAEVSDPGIISLLEARAPGTTPPAGPGTNLPPASPNPPTNPPAGP